MTHNPNFNTSILVAVCIGIIATAYAASASPAKPEGGFASATQNQPWVNSLGIQFVPVPKTDVLVSIWDTRVCDFEEFVSSTGFRASYHMTAIGSDGWMPRGTTWKSPGFKQGPTHPVVGVSWYEAQAFCEWLTQREQSRGLIGKDQRYRLPTDKEWSAAIGGGKYTYGGNSWPPPAGAGNYAGIESGIGDIPEPWGIVTDPREAQPGYEDAYPRTSPVGAFKPNRFGLYDMGGNVWQWCEDTYRASMNGWLLRRKYPFLKDEGFKKHEYRVMRGGSWRSTGKRLTRSDARYFGVPNACNDYTGFRCVLEKPGIPHPKPAAKRVNNSQAFLPCSTVTTVNNQSGPQTFLADASSLEIAKKLKPVPGTRGVTFHLFGNLPTIKAPPGTWLNIHLFARNNPKSYLAANLPEGFKLDPITGIISGKVTKVGQFDIKITAISDSGKGSGTLKIIVVEPDKESQANFRQTVSGRFHP